MPNRRALILDGARRALELRTRLSIGREEPVDPMDVAHRLGIQVWIRDAKTYDGVYSTGAPPVIVLSSHRPAGRTAFTCAHEIGHHVFGHGATVDEVLEDRDSNHNDPVEIQANSFAANLLMPRSLVVQALEARGLRAAGITPYDVLRLSSWIGVGYISLLRHMEHQLSLVDSPTVARLERNEPASIKHALSGAKGGRQDVFLIDDQWIGRTIDCRVEDYIVSTREISATRLLSGIRLIDVRFVYQATAVGIADVHLGSSPTKVRVSRRAKTCRDIYMYESEDDDE